MAAIDVLMPMRDAAPWVASAWRSLVRQTHSDWRLVAVDDGSRDAGSEVLGGVAAGDRRLHLVSQPPAGVAAALNRGLREVSAPVVARMDADDVCHPRRLETLLGELGERPEAGVVASRVRLFPGCRVTPAMAAYLSWQNGLLEPRALYRERYVECTVTHASAAFRTAVLERAEGWWEGQGPEDLDLFLRLHTAGVVFAKNPAELYLWREHRGRETRTSPRLSLPAFRRTKAVHLARELLTRGEGRVTLFGTGSSLAAWRAELEGHGVSVRARRYRPGAPLPAWDGTALFCFGHAKARERVVHALDGAAERQRYVFVS